MGYAERKISNVSSSFSYQTMGSLKWHVNCLGYFSLIRHTEQGKVAGAGTGSQEFMQSEITLHFWHLLTNDLTCGPGGDYSTQNKIWTDEKQSLGNMIPLWNIYLPRKGKRKSFLLDNRTWIETEARGNVVVKALHHEQKSRGFQTNWGELIVSISRVLPAAGGPGVYSATNRNEYQKQKVMFLESRARPVRKADNLTTIFEPTLLYRVGQPNTSRGPY
jgi:hypothetical protein